jgi:microcystin-dependent protein
MYVGEIRLLAGEAAPAGWEPCDGRLRTISGALTLFHIIGTRFGGDGKTTFGLPDLRGRVPMSAPADETTTGRKRGAETAKVDIQHLPAHTHELWASTAQALTNSPDKAVPATMLAAGTAGAYGVALPLKAIHPAAIGGAGNNEAHPNMQPFLTLQYVINIGGLHPGGDEEGDDA